jgi:uncharacterized protein
MRFMRAVAVVIVAGMLAACGHAAAGPAPRLRTLTIATSHGDVRVRVEIADDDAERARGLSDRPSLPAGRGMAFLFGRAVTTRFWMKDTTLPLAIAFWDRGRRIMAIRDMAPCHSDPCATYGPSRAYVGALEVNRGFFHDHGIRPGDRVVFG